MSQIEENLKDTSTEPSGEPANSSGTSDNASSAEVKDAEAVSSPEQQLSELMTQLEEQKDKYLRLYADFDNYKKRMARERLELIDTAGKDVIGGLIPVLDDLERALKNINESQEILSVKEGVQLIHTKLQSYLHQKGLKPMSSIGEVFNPERHEAITEIPAGNEDQKGKVIDEVEKGYMLGEKIIRYAKVVVGK